MAKPKYVNKRGRPRTNEAAKNKRARRNRHGEDETTRDDPSSPSDSGTLSEEPSNMALEDEQEEVAAYKEPTMYDNLLKTLGSASESMADAYKRQCAEEGEGDTDDEENDLESEEDDVSENESERDALDLNDVQGASLAAIEEHSENDEDDDDDDDVDDEDDVDDDNVGNGHSIAKESENSSSFSGHLDYKLSKEEVETLSTKEGKYKWGVDAANCKWLATRELNLEDSYSNSPYGLNMKLYDHWLNTYKASGGHDFHSSRQRSFFSLCNSYRDILHHNKKPFYLKGREEDSSIMDAYLLHSLNHIFKTRDLVTKNDKTLAKHNESKGEEVLNSENFLDQGFTRPKVLILLPMVSIAFRVINRLMQLTPEGHKVNVDHIGRFSEQFGGRQSDDQEDEDGISNPWKKSKPLDHQTLFRGSSDDNFMIGIKFTKKTIKLYSDFYTSDMIVASPLALVKKIEEADAEKEKDVDYLSSIEVLIIDHIDILATMQNWSHLNTVVQQLNHIPSKQHGTDIMRIRPWYLDGQARFYRQTIILGSYVNPDINVLFNHHCLNYEGRVKLLHEHKGVLPKVLLQVRQIYERIDAESMLDDHETRLDYFKKKVFPKIKDSVQGGIMIFISSYFEFVRVRNFLKSEDASMCRLGEYTNNKDISRSRVWFFQGKKKIMLYTERAHFYHRFRIRGIQNLIIYSLPERKDFYPEIVNMLEGSHSMNCTVLFSPLDILRLERIVGATAAKRMVKSDKRIFTFC